MANWEVNYLIRKKNQQTKASSKMESFLIYCGLFSIILSAFEESTFYQLTFSFFFLKRPHMIYIYYISFFFLLVTQVMVACKLAQRYLTFSIFKNGFILCKIRKQNNEHRTVQFSMNSLISSRILIS